MFEKTLGNWGALNSKVLSLGCRDRPSEHAFKDAHFVSSFSHVLARSGRVALFQVHLLCAQISIHADIGAGNVLAKMITVSLSLTLQSLHADSDGSRAVVEVDLLGP